MAIEVSSTEVIQDLNIPHESDDPTSTAPDGSGQDQAAKAMAKNIDLGINGQTSNPEALHCRMVDDRDVIRMGEVNVHLVGQPHESIDEIPHQVVNEESVVLVKPLLTVNDRVLEHSSDSGSKSKFIYRLNQGSKSAGRQRGRKPRLVGSARASDIRSSPSQPIKPYEADQGFEDNENRSVSKKTAKKKTPVATLVFDDNDATTTRRLSQRGDEERFHGTPGRRLPFGLIPASELNIRIGTYQTPEKYTPTKIVATPTSLTPIQVAPTTSVEEEEYLSPILSLQQAGSITAQIFRDESSIESEYADESPSVPVEDDSDEEDTIESALGKQSMEIYGPDDSSEHHGSDKENTPEDFSRPGAGGMTVKLPRGFNTMGNCSREPLQTLYSAPSPSVYQSPDIFTTPTASSQQLHRGRCQVEAGWHWQMVADTSCFLNAESFESLKQLEGIRDTRLVIPNIVIRKLDYLLRQEESKARAFSALQWIEACMLKMPSWIHVQSSADTVHVAMTPPVSPSIYSRELRPYLGDSDMMQPTLDDHVLECAQFQQSIPDGRVAVLTDDTTLKIKALAEGLVVDNAIGFSDSLFNPYSNRFVYAGSTPIGRSSGRLHERLHGQSTPQSTISSSKWPALVARPTCSRPDTPRPTSRANLCTWRKSQPIGLQALLA